MLVVVVMLMLMLMLIPNLMLVLFTRAAATMSMQFFCHVSSLYFFSFYRFFLYRLQSYDMFAATGLHFKGKKAGALGREKRKVKSEKILTFFKEENEKSF